MVRPNALSTPIKRGLLKLKGEGVMDKILATFLLANRTTPNASLPNNVVQLYCYSDVSS